MLSSVEDGSEMHGVPETRFSTEFHGVSSPCTLNDRSRVAKQAAFMMGRLGF